MKRILCLLISAIMVLTLIPLAALADGERQPLSVEIADALNGDGMEMSYSVYNPSQWEVGTDGEKTYAKYNSPINDLMDDSDYLAFDVEMEANQYILVDLKVINDNGENDIELNADWDNGNLYFEKYDANCSDWITVCLKAEEAGTHSVELYIDFDDYRGNEMSFCVRNVRLADEAPIFTVNYVDFRTLETFYTETVELGQDAALPSNELIPMHEGFVFAGYSPSDAMESVLGDCTIYAMYQLEATGVFVIGGTEVDISELPLPEDMELVSNGPDYPWQAVQNVQGTFIRSTNMGQLNTRSIIEFSVPESYNGLLVKFEYFVEGESDCDMLIVNGNYFENSSARVWSAGQSKIQNGLVRFEYYKDGSVDTGIDAAFIRNIELVQPWSVVYTYVDQVTGLAIAEENTLYESEPTMLTSTPIAHEGWNYYGNSMEQDEQGNRTYTYNYYQDVNDALNVADGKLDIYQSLVSGDMPFTVATEDTRTFARMEIVSTYAGSIAINVDTTGFTNPAVKLEFRNSDLLQGLRLDCIGYGSRLIYSENAGQWETAYFALPKDQAGLNLVIQPQIVMNDDMTGSYVTLDIDNIEIVEAEDIVVTVNLAEPVGTTTGMTISTQQGKNVFPSSVAGLVNEGMLSIGFDTWQTYFNDDTQINQVVVPTAHNPAALFSDPNTTDYTLADRTLSALNGFAVATMDGELCYKSYVSSSTYHTYYTQSYLKIGVSATAPKYMALDYFADENETVYLNSYTADGSNYSGKYLSNEPGQWHTAYFEVSAGGSVIIYVRRSSNAVEPSQSAVKNVRGMSELPTFTYTVLNDATGETILTRTVGCGQYVYLDEVAYYLPDGYTLVETSFPNGSTSIAIVSDVVFRFNIEPKIYLEEALNAQGKEIEFYNSNLYQWGTAEVDGRLCAVPRLKTLPDGYYIRLNDDRTQKETRVETQTRVRSEFYGNTKVELGDTLKITYKFESASDNVYLVWQGDGSEIQLPKTSGFETIEITMNDKYDYEYCISAYTGGAQNGYIRSESFVIAIDSIEILPAPEFVARGVYGQKLGELGALPEGWSWVNPDTVLDVHNTGGQVQYVAPESEKLYSDNPHGSATVIILPRDLENNPLEVTDVTTNGKLSGISLPEGFSWAEPETVIENYGTNKEYPIHMDTEVINPRNYVEVIDTGIARLTVYSMGDSNLNFSVDSADAAAILRHIVKLQTLEGLGLKAGNVVQTDELTAADASRILRWIVRLEASLYN